MLDSGWPPPLQVADHTQKISQNYAPRDPSSKRPRLKPHVAQLVVCNPRKLALLKEGNKSDKIDARKLADRLRLNDLKPVYHGENRVRMLRELASSYLTIVKDLSRVMNRLKALDRSWAIPCAGRDVYYTRHRSQWLAKIPRGRHPPASGATRSAIGHAATPASASAARTAGGKSPTYHHGQTTADSPSIRLSRVR